MQKVKIVESELQPSKYRLIINPTDVYSIGIILNGAELRELYYEIKHLIETTEKSVEDID